MKDFTLELNASIVMPVPADDAPRVKGRPATYKFMLHAGETWLRIATAVYDPSHTLAQFTVSGAWKNEEWIAARNRQVPVTVEKNSATSVMFKMGEPLSVDIDITIMLFTTIDAVE